MSKIYEALLRAEMDRIQESNRSPEAESAANTSFELSAPPKVPAKSPLTGRDRGAFAKRANVAAFSAATNGAGQAAIEGDLEERYDEPDGVISAATTTLDGQTRRERWTPDEKRLPSLEARGVLVEQIRVLRSRLHELRLDRPLKTVMITSGLPQEGKSFIAANLAVGFAKFRNQRVLLIDADMRRGKLHQVFGAPQAPGLTDYLSNQASAGEVMQQMELPGSGPLRSLASLTFLPSGHDAENAADLSGNGRFEALLRAVYDHFDWIIIDSSPVTLVADGVNLARVCDGVVLVARSGVTKYEVAQRAQQELKAAKIVGVVLNAVKGIPLVGGYYGYDG